MAENRELALVLKLVADNFQSELKKSGGALGELNSFIKDWKTQLTAVSAALFAIAKSTANYGEELLKTSQKTGINVQALAGLQHAANLADLSDQQLAQGLKFLSVNMVEASRQTGDGELLFRRLGIAATDATGRLRPTEAVLLDVAEAFSKSNDGAGKSEAAVKLFGKAGIDLIPFLNQGKTGIRDLMVEAERLGLVFSQQDAEAANRFNDALKVLAAQARGMTFAVGKELIPVLTELIELFQRLGVGTAFTSGLAFLHERFIGLNVLLKELQANAQFLGGTGKEALSFEGLKARIAEIEAEGTRKLFEARHPGVLTAPGAANPGASSSKQDIGAVADQAKLAKELQEIWKSGNNAIEIRNKLVREGAEGLSLQFLAFDRQEQFRKEDEAAEERRGRQIVEQTSLQVRIREEAFATEREALVQNAQAWLAYHDQVGGSSALRYEKDVALTQATLAQQLQLTQEEAGQLLAAWETHESEKAELILSKTALTAQQRETIELQSLTKLAQAQERASDNVFAGWAKGMQRYARDTQSGFGLGADMARRTAQAMEQGFRNFFFDVMDNKIKGFKDVMRSLLDFVKQIMAQIAAQLVTNAILTQGAAALSALSGSYALATHGPVGTVQPPSPAGAVVRKFAQGGSFIVPGLGGTDSQLVQFMASPGEAVSVRTPSQQRQSSGITIGITVNAGSGERRESGSAAPPNFSQLARDLSKLVEMKIIEEQRPGGLLFGGAA
jgi:hypothetical protein